MEIERKRYPIIGYVRQSYLVDKDFQLRYAVEMVILFAVSASAVGALLAATIVQLRVQADVQGGHRLLVILIVASTLLFLAIFGYAVLMAHRISGPIWVMSRMLDSLAAGKLPWVRALRKNDELQTFFQRLTKAINAIRDWQVEEANRLEETVRRLQTLTSSPEANELLAGLSAMAAGKRAFLSGAEKSSVR
jgi:nitrogen fixation/metabolism regulation signal transduction histidine kinase